ncbi:hypothetical protein M408DRAFT_7243 [Serendipita vermifera MAFF 305830]|uniref:Hydrophobin n=1 Tax=Serendipita vermifera MAFF 305830 TaxID=933852 RepID=A0A0C3B3Z3_SERVB|nr:hypothetical protein M408DRAFT_7243 [Serendipita vermifera MAFF 305830]
MSASPCFPKGLIALATCLAFVNAALGATVDSGRDQPSVRRDQCIDQEGNPINSGFCNKSLVISLAVVLCTRIGSKQTPLGERRPAKVVRVKLPAPYTRCSTIFDRQGIQPKCQPILFLVIIYQATGLPCVKADRGIQATGVPSASTTTSRQDEPNTRNGTPAGPNTRVAIIAIVALLE